MSRSIRKAQAAVRLHGSRKCPEHRDQDVAFVCEDCGNDLLCAKCITHHNRHSLVNLSLKARKTTENLQKFIDRAEKHMVHKLKQEIEMTQKEQTENSKHFEKLIKKVENRGEKIKSEVDKVTTRFVTAYQSMQKQNAAKLQKYLSKLKENLQNVEDHLKKSKESLQSGNEIQIYDTSMEISQNELKFPPVPGLKSADFKENESNLLIDQLKDMLGSFSGDMNINDLDKQSTDQSMTAEYLLYPKNATASGNNSSGNTGQSKQDQYTRPLSTSSAIGRQSEQQTYLPSRPRSQHQS